MEIEPKNSRVAYADATTQRHNGINNIMEEIQERKIEKKRAIVQLYLESFYYLFYL